MDLFKKLKGKKILLIDDDEWIRDSLSLFFESEGCELLALETAEEGEEVLSKQPYDIIIADYKLPGMNGLEFFEHIKTQGSPVVKILITAYGSEEVMNEANTIGIVNIMEKPLTTTAIVETLSKLITKDQQKHQCSLGVLAQKEGCS
jgi:DNA-binding NtrC family response regulator